VTDVDPVDRALVPLAEAAGDLAASARQAAEARRGRGEPADAIPAARESMARLREQARAFIARADDADSWLAALAETGGSAREFDPAAWPARRDALAAGLAAAPLDGAAAWLAAWARAFLLGCPAEADRLATGPFALPPEAAWCPDRLAVATDALAARSLPRLAPLLRYLAAGAPLGGRLAGPDDLRARARILHARLLIEAGQHEAAKDLLGHTGQDGLAGGEVHAARAALARHRVLAGPTGTAAERRGAAQAGQAVAGARARQAWRAERCAATAVEMFHAERGGTGKPRGALETARALVDALPRMADLEGTLDLLVLPVPGEIWLAAADRAARERDFGAARRLADRVGADAGPLLAAEAADLRARIAKQAGAGPAVVADLLAAAGLANAIASRAEPAIDRYTGALALVSGHQDATLGLADALLVAGWGKPLREEAGQFGRAVALLDASYAAHPPQAGTSWSLMTYSYLASALSNQVVAEARAREIWRAPIAAARAIAFDPAQAQRWVRLAETLIELNCDYAAAVLSEHAHRLAPDDPVVVRNRIATLTNLGDAGAALALLGQAARDGSDGWFSAVRAIALSVSAATAGQAEAGPERLEAALGAANEALRAQPENPWYRLVRADVLLRAGKDDLAGQDFEVLWRESRLDQADGLSFATRAAIELGLGADAVALSAQALDLATATVGDYGDRFNRGAALVLDGNARGVSYLEAAAGLAATPFAIDCLRARLDHLGRVLRRDGIAVDLTAAAGALAARQAQAAADGRPPAARIEAELDRVAGNGRYPAEVGELAVVATALTRAWCGLALGDPGALVLLSGLAREHPEYPELAEAATALAAVPPPGPERPGGPAATGPAHQVPGEQELEAYLPASWFAGLANPLDHEIVKRFVPDARARLRRRTGTVLPGVNFRDDASLEPAGFRVLLHGATVAEGRLRPERWYCPAHLAAALGPRLRAELSSAPEAAGPAPFPALRSAPAPGAPDPLTALVAWPPAEVVARRLEHAYAAWRAAQQDGTGPPDPPSRS
jgi:tetratricopeptide (TPR) repeat protein